MFKFLLRIIKDERGGLPLIAGLAAGAVAGGGLMSALGKGKTSTYDPFGRLREPYMQSLESSLGQSTPYQYNPAFETKKPEAESQLESGVLGKLQNLPGIESDIFGITGKYAERQKSNLEEQKAKDIKDTQNMYNRLGLVSSSPGMQGVQDVRSDYANRFKDLDAELSMQGIQQEMEARQLSENIANMYFSQANVLGQQQRGYEQSAISGSMADIERQFQEKLAYDELLTNLLTNNPAQFSYTPSFMEKFGGALTSAGGTALGASIGAMGK